MAASTNYDIIPQVHNSQQALSSALSAPIGTVCAGSVAALGAATVYLVALGQNKSASATPIYFAGRACTIQNLAVLCGTAPGGSDTVIVTVQVSTDKGANWTDTTLTATVPAAGTATYDTTHFVAIAKGSLLNLKAVSSGATAAIAVASFEVV